MPLCFLAPHHVLLGGGTGGASLDPRGPASSQDRLMDTLPTESGGIWRSLRGSVQTGRLSRGPPGAGCARTPPHTCTVSPHGSLACGSLAVPPSLPKVTRHPAGPGLWPQPVTLLPSEPPPQTSRTPRTAFPWLPGSTWEQGEARLGWTASRYSHRGCCCSLLPETLVTSCPHNDNAGGGSPEWEWPSGGQQTETRRVLGRVCNRDLETWHLHPQPGSTHPPAQRASVCPRTSASLTPVSSHGACLSPKCRRAPKWTSHSQNAHWQGVTEPPVIVP